VLYLVIFRQIGPKLSVDTVKARLRTGPEKPSAMSLTLGLQFLGIAPLPASPRLLHTDFGHNCPLCRDIGTASRARSVQAGRVDLAGIIESWHPPDEDYQDLLEDAFLSHQIDSLTYELACLWMDSHGISET